MNTSKHRGSSKVAAFAKRGLGRLVAVGVVSALAISTSGLPAIADVHKHIDEPAEAAASVINSSIAGKDLVGGALSEASSKTNPGPNREPLNIGVLGKQVVSLGSLSLPITDLIDFGQMGALLSESQASGPRDAHAISGLAGADGSLTLDGAKGDFGAARINLLALFKKLGLDGLTNLALSQADVLLGAGGAEVTAKDGKFLDPDGVGGAGQYRVAEASLLVKSLVVEKAAGVVYDAIGQIDRTIETQSKQLLDLTKLLAALPVGASLEGVVKSNMQEEIFKKILAQPITSKNKVIEIDFSKGTLQVHLDQLLSGKNRPGQPTGINNQNPNTELINDEIYPMIAETIHDLMEEVTNIVLSSIDGALKSITVEFTATLKTGLADAKATWKVNLGGDLTDLACVPGGIGGELVCATLTTAINTVLKPLFNTVIAPIRDFILSDGGKQIFKLLITDIKTSGMTVPIRELLRPFINVVAQVVSVQLNHQVTTTCVPKTLADATPVIDSLEVSAFSVGLAQASDAARISIGNAGARIDACGSVTPGDVKVSVDPKSGKPGDSVTFTGEGFTPKGEASVELVDPSGKVIATVPATAGDDGKVPATKVTVPKDATPGKDYKIRGTDKTTSKAGEVPFEVTGPSTGAPKVAADPASGKPGDVTSVTGEGFTPKGEASVELVDPSGKVIATVPATAGDDGKVPATKVTVPKDATPGKDYKIRGTDKTTSKAGEVPFEVTSVKPGEPKVTVDPKSGKPGDSVTVNGEGLTPKGETTVELVDPSGKVIATVPATAGDDGKISAKVTVPEGAKPGSYTVVVTDKTSGAKSSTPFDVVDPNAGTLKVTAKPAAAKPGDCTVVTGEGFAPKGEATVELVDPSGKVIATVPATAGDDGKISAKVNVPDGAKPGKDYKIRATDKGSNKTVELPFEVLSTDDPCPCTHKPVVSLDLPNVPVGGTVKITGKGFSVDTMVTIEVKKSTPKAKTPALMFAASEPELDVLAADAEPERAVEPIVVPVGPDSAFAASIAIPKDAELGAYDVLVQGENGENANGSFTVVAASVDPGSNPGTNPGGTNPGGTNPGGTNPNGTGNGQSGNGDYRVAGLANTGSIAGSLLPLALLMLLGGAAAFFIGRQRKAQKS